MSSSLDQVLSLTAKEFEAEVEDLLRKSGVGLSEFKVERLEKIDGADGVYEIDVVARFEALGGNVLVLIECKHHKHPIKREVVQILYDRLRAVGGHKGMIFSTARFQKGAIEFAQAHGIALVQVADARTSYVTKSFGEPKPLPSWMPPYVGWIVILSADGNESNRLMTEGDSIRLLERFNEITA